MSPSAGRLSTRDGACASALEPRLEDPVRNSSELSPADSRFANAGLRRRARQHIPRFSNQWLLLNRTIRESVDRRSCQMLAASGAKRPRTRIPPQPRHPAAHSHTHGRSRTKPRIGSTVRPRSLTHRRSRRSEGFRGVVQNQYPIASKTLRGRSELARLAVVEIADRLSRARPWVVPPAP
jgi:hypothetical protein